MAPQGIDQHQSMRLSIAQMKVANDEIRPARFSQFKACRIDSAVLSSQRHSRSARVMLLSILGLQVVGPLANLHRHGIAACHAVPMRERISHMQPQKRPDQTAESG